MRLPLLAVTAAVIPLMACSATAQTMPDHSAHAAMAGATQRAPVGASATAALAKSDGADAGTASFRQGPNGVLIRIEATGLTPGWHGLHLHAVGQCDGPAFTSAGAHIQHGEPKIPHGLLNAEGNDAGDLPNLYVGADGHGFAELFTTTARLVDGAGPGEYLLDADGSSLVIHANPDDYSSQPIGGAGDRVACGVVTSG